MTIVGQFRIGGVRIDSSGSAAFQTWRAAIRRSSVSTEVRWAAHRTAANATMLDVSDVLLLRPVRSDGGFLLEDDRMTPGARPSAPTTVLAAVYALAKQADDALVSQFESRLRHA